MQMQMQMQNAFFHRLSVKPFMSTDLFLYFSRDHLPAKTMSMDELSPTVLVFIVLCAPAHTSEVCIFVADLMIKVK